VPLGSGLISTPGFIDEQGAPGDRYRLSAVNGLGEELEIGHIAASPRVTGLAVWPSPARAGTPLHMIFPTPTVILPGAGPTPVTDLDVSIFDAQGRRVARVGRATWKSQGTTWSADWNGRLDSGGAIESGVYWARVSAPSAGTSLQKKFVIVR
jgi:hypothetical protein